MSGSLIDTAELVFGLVAPVGTDLQSVTDELQQILKSVSYAAPVIRLSNRLRESGPPEIVRTLARVREDGPADSRIRAHMDAGDRFRADYGRDAMAWLAIQAIQIKRRELFQNSRAHGSRERAERVGSQPSSAQVIGKAGSGAQRTGPTDRVAYILHQLKRPEEVKCLREVYGPAFILIAISTPRAQRVENLALRIAQSRHVYHTARYRAAAEYLIRRDEEDSEKEGGQDVRNTFPLADLFISGTDARQRKQALHRFVELLFGQTLHTPTRDEMAMYHAQAAALQSASLGRQVGAAIAADSGELVATGANEVPKAGGGVYWPEDENDYRDHVLGEDPSDKMKRDVLADILQRLKRNGWFVPERCAPAVQELVRELLDTEGALMKDAHFMNLIEFMRPVHAEMAALCSAARRGVSVQDMTLYVTTFPCHACAKHIIACGIKKVVYVQPYAKSLTPSLYSDSVSTDPPADKTRHIEFTPFVGVAPRRFIDWFSMADRKNKQGKVLAWEGTTARARLGDWKPSIDLTMFREDDDQTEFAQKQQATVPRSRRT